MYLLYVDNIEVYIMSCYTCTYIRTVCYIVMYQYEVYTVFTRMYMYAVFSCIYVHVIMSLLYNIYLLVRIYTCSAIIEGLADIPYYCSHKNFLISKMKSENLIFFKILSMTFAFIGHRACREDF